MGQTKFKDFNGSSKTIICMCVNSAVLIVYTGKLTW